MESTLHVFASSMLISPNNVLKSAWHLAEKFGLHKKKNSVLFYNQCFKNQCFSVNSFQKNQKQILEDPK
jgi:hypothetical protein